MSDITINNVDQTVINNQIKKSSFNLFRADSLRRLGYIPLMMVMEIYILVIKVCYDFILLCVFNLSVIYSC